MYRRARALKGVKKILIGSGLRYDLAVQSPEYVKELVQHHVGGYLKIAPEHTEQGPLTKMMKPGIGSYDKFKALFEKYSAEAGKKQYLIPYFIAAHPGTSDEDMMNLALWLKKNGFRADQVQTFYPSPMATATAMYHTGQNPLRKITRDSETVDIVRGEQRRRLHKAFLRYHDANNWPLLREALKAMGRADLIGNGKHQLIPTYQPITDGSYQSARRKNSTPTATSPPAPGKGRMLTQHTGLPPAGHRRGEAAAQAALTGLGHRPGRSGRRPALGHSRQQTLDVGHPGGLGQVMIEAGAARAGAVVLRAPARQGHQHRLPRFRLPAQFARDLVAVLARHADVQEHDLGPEVVRGAQGLVAVVGHARRVALHFQQRRQALGRVHVVVHHQHPERRAPAGPPARTPERAPAPRLLAASPSGRRTVNVLPRPTPGLSAVTLPPCSSTSRRTSARPMPRPPCARSSLRPTWVNISNTSGRASGAMPMPVSVTEITTWSPSRRAARSIRPPSGVYFTALFSRLLTTWAIRVRVGDRSAGLRRAAARPACGRPRSPAACWSRRRWPARLCRSTRSLRSSTLPLEMRAMSSRSSTSRTRCLSWRSIMSRARSQGLWVVGGHAHQLQAVGDRRQRIAQLVGEGGQELGLAPVGLGQLGRQPPQVFLGAPALRDVVEQHDHLCRCPAPPRRTA